MREIVKTLLGMAERYQEKTVDWHCENGDFSCGEDEDGKYGPTWPELDPADVEDAIIDEAFPDELTPEEIAIVSKAWSDFDLADQVKERVEDAAAYNRDVYAYFGVSRKDFF